MKKKWLHAIPYPYPRSCLSGIRLQRVGPTYSKTLPRYCRSTAASRHICKRTATSENPTQGDVVKTPAGKNNLKAREYFLGFEPRHETAAALYSGFSNWDTFMAVYKYLDPGDREQNISYWRSLDADISADLSTVETEEPLAKTGRTRPLNLGG
ncbi:unnamed protein product, partial [Porites evermanni]